MAPSSHWLLPPSGSPKMRKFAANLGGHTCARGKKIAPSNICAPQHRLTIAMRKFNIG
jgi:hypothetical protein